MSLKCAQSRASSSKFRSDQATTCGKLDAHKICILPLSNTTSGAKEFNQPLSSWNVARVTDLAAAFSLAEAFDQDLNDWDVTNVQTTRFLFRNALSFNRPLDQWQLGNLTDAPLMFTNAAKFNQDVSSWELSSAENLSYMFVNATSFNQNLCTWGKHLPKSAIVQGMFWWTDCPTQENPDLEADPPGPFCHPCSNQVQR